MSGEDLKISAELDKRKEIIEDSTGNFFLSAGAGAGKTYTIVQRIINQLKSGVIKPEELVVITFTKKAAAELYDRISRDLKKACEDENLGPNEKENLRNALLHIDTMTVSTIHSFCYKLLSECAFDAKIAFNATMMEAEEEEKEQKGFFEEWYLENTKKGIVKDAISRKESYEGIVKLWYHKENSLAVFKDIANKMLDKKLQVFYPECPLDENTDYTAVFQGMYTDFISEIRDFTESQLGYGADWKCLLQDDANKKVSSPIGFVEFVWQKANDISKVLKERNVNGIDSKNIRKFKKEFAEIVREKISLHKDLENYFNYGYYATIKTAVDAAKEYNESRVYTKLSNDDLLYKTRDLLSLGNTSEEAKRARSYFAKKYKCIYVDEFQDTDHIQKEMLWGLACEEDGSLKNGALFVVGDAKQSIYRFRGAEPEIFTETRDEMVEARAKAESFEINFRSNPAIIAWVNAKFKDALKDTEEYKDMLCKNDAGDYEGCFNGVYRFNSNSELRNNDIDAEEVCRFIAACVHNENVKIKRKTENGFIDDRVKYSDFLILSKDTTNVAFYKKAFKKYNIPVIFGTKKKVESEPVIGRFTALYSFLANSSDKKSIAGAMIAVLGEDFFRASDEQWEKAKERVSALYEYTKGMSAYALAEYLSHRVDLLLPYKDINKAEMTMAVSTLRQMVDTVLKNNKGSRASLAEAFKAYRVAEAGNDLPLAQNYNAVRFMNVHQAKGLEGNIVIIADIGAEKSNAGAYKQRYEDKVVYYPTIGKEKYKKALVSFVEDLRAMERTVREAENQRFKYVTATRAREALIFMPKVVKKDGWIDSDVAEDSCVKVNDLYLEEDIEPKTEEAKPIQREDWEKELSSAQTSPLYNTLNPSLVKAVHSQKTESFEGEDVVDSEILTDNFSAVTDMEKVYDEDTENDDNIRANYLGTAMHRMFELIVNDYISSGKDKSKIPAYTKTAIAVAMSEGMENMGENASTYEARLKAFAKAFAEDDALLDKIASADSVYTELPFSFFIDSGEEARTLSEAIDENVSLGTWVNGTADLVLVKGNVATVLDYKSNRNRDASPDFTKKLYEKYSGQLALYKFAMKKLLGVEKVETELVNYQV
ncbi:MAG: UvrD-helicase domain-containing protein [Firmicutes bacterium]|nr:UvrD-helicase domain-containing protein [Bacillota bacterium]